jgi:hypothetical protein
MPDYSIALQNMSPQIQSPNELMTNAYAMQNARQANELNMLKMNEYKSGLAEQDKIKNELALAQSPKDVVNVLTKYGKTKEAADYAYRTAEAGRVGAETTNLGHTGLEIQAKTAKIKAEHATQMLRDLSQNPSNANITAHFEDIQNSPIYTPEEKLSAKARLDQVLQMPVEQRQAYLASQGASASDLKPHIQTQNLGGTSNVLSIPAYGGAPTTLSSNKMTATPGELLTAATAKAGQAITVRGQDQTNARELEKIAIDKGKNSSEYIAMKAKMEEQGKGQAKFEATAPQAIATAEQMLTKIDDMVGKPTIKDKATGKVIEKGTPAHPGFKAAVGASSLFPTMPGSKAADFEARLDEIKGGAFLEAYNTLRGGGSITEVEGQKATQAITRMSTAQSEKEFIDAARDFQAVIRTGIKRSKEKLGSSGTDVDALLEKYK